MTLMLSGAAIAMLILLPLVVYFWRMNVYWKNRFVDSGYGVELNLATKHQIIDELRSRELDALIILEPSEQKDGLTVATHAINCEPPVIVAAMKAAYEGMAAYLGVDIEEN